MRNESKVRRLKSGRCNHYAIAPLSELMLCCNDFMLVAELITNVVMTVIVLTQLAMSATLEDLKITKFNKSCAQCYKQ